MGLTAPYDTFTGDYETKNAFAQAANKLMTDGKTSVAWSFNATPNVDDWRADVVSALTAYTAGEGEWDAVKTAFVFCPPLILTCATFMQAARLQ